MIRSLLLFSFILLTIFLRAQIPSGNIQTSFVLQQERDNLRKNLYNYTIQQSFALPLNRETEYRYQSAFWAISQFMVYNDVVRKGFRNTLDAYHDSLATETRRAFLEAVYTTGPSIFLPDMKRILPTERNPKLASMIMLWILKQEPGSASEMSRILAARRLADSTNKIYKAMALHLELYGKMATVPSLHDLFAHQRTHGQKIIYSFQNRNRDFPGIAIIQKADGTFERDARGKLLGFGQLARAASSLPYFITNGNTPQGIYSISGLDTSGNNFIGPTPNLQMAMPFEYYWHRYFLHPVDTLNPLSAYQSFFPPSWQSYNGIYEAYRAGEIGRTEIIAHGTTIDPAFFSGKPYYPYSPTLGCLCAKEIWDPATGKVKESEQLNLVNGFIRSPGTKGYLAVIDYFGVQRPLTTEDLEKFVSSFEQKYKR